MAEKKANLGFYSRQQRKLYYDFGIEKRSLRKLTTEDCLGWAIFISFLDAARQRNNKKKTETFTVCAKSRFNQICSMMKTSFKHYTMDFRASGKNKAMKAVRRIAAASLFAIYFTVHPRSTSVCAATSPKIVKASELATIRRLKM